MTVPSHPIHPLAGGLLAAALVLSILWIGDVVACRLLPEARAGVRIAAAFVTSWSVMVALFWVTIAAGLFELWFVTPVLVVGALLAHRLAATAGATPARRLRADLREGRRRLVRLLRGPLVAMVAVSTGVVVGARMLRGAVAPPLAWDAVTFHLFKAGTWVQSGRWVPDLAPDHARLTEFYPVTGDIPWAWTMLPVRSDTLIPWVAALVWMVALFALYQAARELGAEARTAAIGALAVGSIPSALAALTSAYVDNQVVALFALATVFVVRLSRGASIVEAPVAVAALSMMVGVKPTTAPIAVAGALFVLWVFVRSGVGIRRSWPIALAMIAALALGTPTYLRAWIVAGSPLHPFDESVGPDLEVAESLEREPGEVAALLLFRPTAKGAFVNPGLGGALVVLIGLVGLFRGAARRGDRRPWLFLAISMIGIFGLVALPQSGFFLSSAKVATFGRYLLPGFGAAALLGTGWGGGRARWVFAPAAVVGAVQSWPRGWRLDVEAEPLLLTAGLLAGTLALGWLVVRSGWRSWPRGTRVALLVTLVGLSSWGLTEIRERWRYPIWHAAAHPRQPLFHLHELHPVYANAWGIWQALDDPDRPLRLAVTAGWDGLGHNWYRYPLLGRRLQNQVTYVPVTASGEIVDYRDREEVTRRASLEAWLRRLHVGEFDAVISLAPRTTIEEHWMQRHADLFALVAGDRAGFHRLYEIDRDRLEVAVAGAGPRLNPG